jgi:hypothetical protein
LLNLGDQAMLRSLTTITTSYNVLPSSKRFRKTTTDPSEGRYDINAGWSDNFRLFPSARQTEHGNPSMALASKDDQAHLAQIRRL